MRFSKISVSLIFIITLGLGACCHSKKQQESKSPAAKDVLKDRNTKDPRIDSMPKKVEKAVSE